jgi:hypothetical protein
MSRIRTNFYREQYSNFKEYVVSVWAVKKTELTPLEEYLKQIHRRYLSLACASTIIGQKAARRIHIEVVPEACHLSIVLAIKGLENPACVLLRQSIELVLKHIFFFTHPVEFGWANSREGYKELTFQKLIEYLDRTEELQKLEKGSEIRDRLNELFNILSRYVHVHSKKFIGYNIASRTYKPKVETIIKFNQRTREIWPLLTAILIVYFPKQYLRASDLERKIIRDGINRDLKTAVDKYLIDAI